MESTAAATPEDLPPDENAGVAAPASAESVAPIVVAAAASGIDGGGGGGGGGGADKEKIIRYDFRHPSLLTPSESRKLQQRYVELARSLATRFSIFLRMEFAFEIKSISTRPFHQFVQSVPNPTHFTLFKIESFDGIGLWEMPRELGLRIVDRLMGGPGEALENELDLTEIDTALSDLATQIIIKEWIEHVARQPESRATIVGHECNGSFLQIIPNDTHMIVLNMEAVIGETKSPVNLAFPYEMLQPVIRQLGPVVTNRKQSEPSAPPPDPTWNPGLGNVRLPVDAQWTGLQVTTRKLTELKVGDVLPIDALHGEKVQIQLAKVAKYVGRLGKCGRCWAVELTGAVSK